jgi:hypothetical protein
LEGLNSSLEGLYRVHVRSGGPFSCARGAAISRVRRCIEEASKDVSHGDQVAKRAIVMQHKTKRPVQFEITEVTREALQCAFCGKSVKCMKLQ